VRFATRVDQKEQIFTLNYPIISALNRRSTRAVAKMRLAIPT